MESETGPEQVRPARVSTRVVSPRRSTVRSSLVVQDSPPRQATARRHCTSTALQAVCVEHRDSRALSRKSEDSFDAGSARAEQKTPRCGFAASRDVSPGSR
eukprot:4970382-Prymnesium_polylepis.1